MDLFVNGVKFIGGPNILAILAMLQPKVSPFSIVNTFTIYEEVYKLEKDFDSFIFPHRRLKDFSLLQWPHERRYLRPFDLETARRPAVDWASLLIRALDVLLISRHLKVLHDVCLRVC